MKPDGFRALAYLQQGKWRFVLRRGNEMKRFDELAALIAKELRVKNAVLDGEIVALDADGMPAFYNLMKKKSRAAYFAFDVPWLNGHDLRN